ncbi:MAG: insulinase family protein, partial [Actinobacteria bacterium]|nr:insulinase family protein [Actinomycetota bacterium]
MSYWPSFSRRYGLPVLVLAVISQLSLFLAKASGESFQERLDKEVERHESYGEKGMAHLLEHLLFKGSPRFPDIKAEFMRRGARWNGTTSYDRTNYFETLPATGDNLAFALAAEADRMVNAWVRKADLDSEMTVVRNEFESGQNSPGNVLHQRISQALFSWHNYGNPIIGARSDIENVPIERLRGFYQLWYQPDNAVLLLSGNFDEANALALIEKSFAPIAKPKRALPALYTSEPT